MADRKTAKLLKSAKAKVADGDIYQGSQLYLTVISRTKDPVEAMRIAAEGAQLLLTTQGADQAMGATVAHKLLEVLQKYASDPDVSETAVVEFIMVIKSVYKQFDTSTDTGKVLAVTFLKAALTALMPKKTDDSKQEAKSSHQQFEPALAQIQQALAELIEDQGKPGEAQRYWLRANQPGVHAKAVLKWAAQGPPSEVDLFVTRSVMQYLCLGNMYAANTFYRAVLEASTELDTPLIHFCQFLLKTCERDARPLFVMLQGKYALSLKRDREFAGYLTKIGAVYFGMETKKGLFEDLFK